MWLRLAIVWIGAALGGSTLGTLILQLFGHYPWTASETRFATMTLFWTVPGSALLFLVFNISRGSGLSIGLSKIAVVVLGTIAGALALGLLNGRPIILLVGALYGLVTALGWVALGSAVGGFRLESHIR